MPYSRRFGALLKTRAFYTGESYRELKSTVRLQNSDPIPAAHPDQQLLESEVFISLANIGDWYAHPLGIVRTHPAERRPARIWLDSHSTLPDQTRRALARMVVQKLLPTAEPDGELRGISGLRVCQIAGRELTLCRIGSNAQISLRAVAGTRWTHVISAHRNRVGTTSIPLWDRPNLSEYEEKNLRDYADLNQVEHQRAWLGSGLLRRVALFENATTAHTISSWTTADRLIFELETRRDVAVAHDIFLDRLTDPVWGLPLRIEHSTCKCASASSLHPPYRAALDSAQECRFDLRHNDGRPGVLQLRFHNSRVCYHANLRTHLDRLGAPTAWLNRTLPDLQTPNPLSTGRQQLPPSGLHGGCRPA